MLRIKDEIIWNERVMAYVYRQVKYFSWIVRRNNSISSGLPES